MCEEKELPKRPRCGCVCSKLSSEEEKLVQCLVNPFKKTSGISAGSEFPGYKFETRSGIIPIQTGVGFDRVIAGFDNRYGSDGLIVVRWFLVNSTTGAVTADGLPITLLATTSAIPMALGLRIQNTTGQLAQAGKVYATNIETTHLKPSLTEDQLGDIIVRGEIFTGTYYDKVETSLIVASEWNSMQAPGGDTVLFRNYLYSADPGQNEFEKVPSGPGFEVYFPNPSWIALGSSTSGTVNVFAAQAGIIGVNARELRVQGSLTIRYPAIALTAVTVTVRASWSNGTVSDYASNHELNVIGPMSQTFPISATLQPPFRGILTNLVVEYSEAVGSGSTLLGGNLVMIGSGMREASNMLDTTVVIGGIAFDQSYTIEYSCVAMVRDSGFTGTTTPISDSDVRVDRVVNEALRLKGA